MKVLLIGQAPGRAGDGSPLEGAAGLRLAEFAGISYDEYLRVTDRVNLLRKWPGRAPGGKGDLFPIAEAQLAAMQLDIRGRVVVMVGKGVARAFSVHTRAPLAWFTLEDRISTRMAWMYHPSGVNRWYNDPENVAATSRFLRAALNTR